MLGGRRRCIGGCVSASPELIVLAGGENVEELSRWLGGETPAAQEVGQATEEIPSLLSKFGGKVSRFLLLSLGAGLFVL